MAAVLGVGLIPVAGELPSYYYSVLLAFGLLAGRCDLVGAGLRALAAITSAVPWLLWWNDERYLVISAATVAFVIASTAHVAWVGARRLAVEGAGEDASLRGRARP